MALMPINGSGITSEGTKSQKASQTPTRWMQTMLNYVTIWHAWLAGLVAFLVARMLWNVLYACSSFASTADSFTNNLSQTTTLTSWASWAHCFRYSHAS